MFVDGFEFIKRYWSEISTKELKNRSKEHESFGWRIFLMGILSMIIFDLPKLSKISKCAITLFSACMVICIMFFATAIVENIIIANRDGSFSELIEFFEKINQFVKKDKKQFSNDELLDQYHFGLNIEQICLIIVAFILIFFMLLTKIYFILMDEIILISSIIAVVLCIFAICCIICRNQIKDELQKRQ